MSAGLLIYMSLLFLGGMAYIISLGLEVSGHLTGIFFLLVGWMSLGAINEDPFVALAWLANPLVLAAWILSFKRMNLMAVGAACAALTLSALFLLGHEVPVNEAGGISPRQHGPGYDFWLASMAIALAATLVRAALERDQRGANQGDRPQKRE
jgi:hypothetical protein